MARDFSALSPPDFEELARDLLQEEWKVALEAFKTGRDTGIDLRYAPAHGGTTIVQCKHYARSGYNKLLSDLRNVERPKIERLAPSRYVVVTSVGLTPLNKAEIAIVLHPFVVSHDDIKGANDIDGLLRRHPQVERANFKLWFTSTDVMERVLHNAEHVQTDFAVDRICRKLPLFVQGEAYPRAAELLDQTRIACISGVPGIGKTTRAEMLLYAHLEQGYEPVVIQSEIAEGRKLYKPKAKQIFYYDDFLGQTFLGDRSEYLGRNQDAAIIDFMEMVGRSAHARFILTTREHILQNALLVSERFSRNPIFTHRCVLELKDYSYAHKARILYNHLYFSDLPQAYKVAVIEDKFFLTIIKHDHFNPRLIEWLSSQARLKNVTPSQYRAHIAALLDSPHSIWAHAFQNQISERARHALVSLYTVGDSTETCDLEPAFSALHRHSYEKYHQPITPGDFRRALQELDGGFLSYKTDRAGFLNPSIKEFIASVVAGNRQIVEDILASAVRFKQVVNLWRLAESQPDSELIHFLVSNPELSVRAVDRLLDGRVLRWETMRDGSRRGYHIDIDDEGRIGFLAELAGRLRSGLFASLALKAGAKLTQNWPSHIPDFVSVIHLLDRLRETGWFLTQGGKDLYRTLLNGVLDQLEFARASDWQTILPFPESALEWTAADDARLDAALTHYRTRGADEERSDCTTLNELTDLRESLDDLDKKYGLGFARLITSIEEDIAEREDTPYEDDDHPRFSSHAGPAHRDMTTDDDVAQMFSTLQTGD